MPNLSRKGDVNSPLLVVAATRVNLGSLIRYVLAAGPLPATQSKAKSSMAGYKASSA